MGVWIETFVIISVSSILRVTPCVGVWIETLLATALSRIEGSHPAWVCGLKHIDIYLGIHGPCHTLRGCVD